MKLAWGICTLGAVLGCTTSSFAPLHTKLVYQVNVLRCSNGCSVTAGSPDTVRTGDSLRVTIALADTAPADSIIILLRATCDVNVSVLSGRTVKRTLPAATTCPDSQYARQILGTAASDETRLFVWVVDSTLAPGPYALRADILVDPPFEARRPIVVK